MRFMNVRSVYDEGHFEPGFLRRQVVKNPPAEGRLGSPDTVVVIGVGCADG
jgi:hypothetical protein